MPLFIFTLVMSNLMFKKIMFISNMSHHRTQFYIKDNIYFSRIKMKKRSYESAL